MRKIDVHIGDRYGRLTIIGEPYSVHSPCGQSKRKVKCKCDCGSEREYFLDLIRRGHTKSCGCFNSEEVSRRRKTHGMSAEAIYHMYHSMIARCNNPNNHAYERYGGRGIAVCDEWKKDYMAFYNWAMSNGWRSDLTLDRIDNDGNYEPSNCRWASMREQSNNRRNTKFYTIDGETKTLSQWCEVYDQKYDRASSRLRNGWMLKDALEKPIKKMNLCRQ